MNGRALKAQMSLRCCGTTVPDRTQGPCWQVYVVLLGQTEWPAHTWPTSPVIPLPEEREAALAALGFEPVPGTEWTWTEDTTPEYHAHPVQVGLIAAIQVRPVAASGKPGPMGVTERGTA